MSDKLYRSFKLDRSKKKEDRYELSFSSELAVRRHDPDDDVDYDEVLSHDPDDVDLSRAKDGLPLCDMHDLRRQIGKVEDISVGEDRKGRGFARFSSSSIGKEVRADVDDGIKDNVSVGYEYVAEKSRSNVNGVQKRVYSWRPYEVSIVSAPEDPEVGIGRCRRALEHQSKALSEAIAALSAVSPTLQPGKAKSSCDVAITALESAIQDFTPGAADVAWEECAEAISVLRSQTDPLSQAACAACSAAAEVCYQVWAGSSRSISETKKDKHQRMRLLFAPDAPPSGGGTITESKPEIGVTNERARCKRINDAAATLAEKFPEKAELFRGKAARAVESGQSSEEFGAAIMPEIPGITAARTMTYASLGASREEALTYSIVRGIQSCIKNNSRQPSGCMEAELHQEAAQRFKASGISPSGFLVPFDIPAPVGHQRSMPAGMRRDMQVGVFGNGGALVPTMLQATPVELLRNRMVCARLGVQTLAGLEGNVAIPRQTAAATAYNVSEIAALTVSNQVIDQIALAPKRIGGFAIYSKQLLAQAVLSIEQFVRDDLLQVIAIKTDRDMLQGQGAQDEMMGIMNQPGIGSVSFSATATWAKVVEFETRIASANADVQGMSFITTPSVRGKWKTIPKAGTTNQFPIYIWENGDWPDEYNDGKVNSYRAAVTNQIANDLVAFGNFGDAIHAMWGALDIVVDPYSQSKNAEVTIAVNTWSDIAVRHAASFVWSADSGAQ